jgi:hypothetical protein
MGRHPIRLGCGAAEHRPGGPHDGVASRTRRPYRPGIQVDDVPRAPSVVLVMAEYGDLDGLGDRSPGARCSLRAGQLGVSAGLTARLRAWNAEFDRCGRVGWDDVAAEEHWLRAGLHLAYDLPHELGPGIDVRYHHDGDLRPVSERRGG